MGVQVNAFSLSYSSLLPILFSHNVIQVHVDRIYILLFSIDLFTVTFVMPCKYFFIETSPFFPQVIHLAFLFIIPHAQTYLLRYTP